jgi:acyl-CoA thioesterase FadM
MSRWLRFLMVALGSYARPRLAPTDIAVVRAHVWPTDADLSVANNAAYLVFFEMARIEQQLRTGLARVARKKGWVAVLGSINVQFRKPLRRFQAFQVSAQLTYWDDRCLYLEQRLERAGETVATALARVMVLGRDGRVAPTAAIAEVLGSSLSAPDLPPMIASLQEAERLLREHLDEPQAEGPAGDGRAGQHADAAGEAQGGSRTAS